MDHGVATFPQDGEQADQLIRVADERLYRLKHANHTRHANGVTRAESSAASQPADVPPVPTERSAAPSRPISIESKRAPEKTEAPPVPITFAAADSPAPHLSGSAVTSPSYAVQRKAERVSMSGTNAYAVLREQNVRRARVLDLGFGGVALELDTAENLSESIY